MGMERNRKKMRKKAGSIIAAVLTASIVFSGFNHIEVKAAG